MDNQCDQCIIRHFSSVTKFAEKKLIYSSYCEGIRSLKRGEVLFKEGQYINGVFCIRSGVCKVSKMSVNGRNQIIKLIREGDLIGERSLISEEPSNLQATALNDIEVCFIPKEEIINDLKNDHDFTMNILKRLAVSLKEADNLVVDMAQKTVKQRLAETLLYLDKNFGKSTYDPHDIHLSREDIASLVGTATESVIRWLSSFKRMGIIHLKGKEIYILKPNVLKHLAEGY